MTYRTHTIFGVALAVITVRFLFILNIRDLNYLITGNLFNPDLIKFYLAVMLGSLLPDIDHANSKIGRKLPLINGLLRLFGIKHRGLTHSLIGVVLIVLLFHQLHITGWIGEVVLIALIIGYISHLIADMLNPHGIPLFFPNKLKFNLLKITTSSWGESVFSVVVLFLLSAFVLHLRGIVNLDFVNFTQF